jgi:hypothetical protein
MHVSAQARVKRRPVLGRAGLRAQAAAVRSSAVALPTAGASHGRLVKAGGQTSRASKARHKFAVACPHPQQDAFGRRQGCATCHTCGGRQTGSAGATTAAHQAVGLGSGGRTQCSRLLGAGLAKALRNRMCRVFANAPNEKNRGACLGTVQFSGRPVRCERTAPEVGMEVPACVQRLLTPAPCARPAAEIPCMPEGICAA